MPGVRYWWASTRWWVRAWLWLARDFWCAACGHPRPPELEAELHVLRASHPSGPLGDGEEREP